MRHALRPASRTLATAAALAALAVTAAACGGDGGGGGGLPGVALTRSVGGPALIAATPVAVGRGPSAVAVSGGVVWVANTLDGTITRLDARTGRPLGRAVAIGPGPLAVAGDGRSVWVALGDGSIVRVDPVTGRPVLGVGARVPGATDLALGEGAVWVTSRDRGTLTRLDPVSGRVRGATRVAGGPSDVVVGGGSVWVAQGAPARPGATAGVVRVDPKSGAVRGRTPLSHNQVLALAWGEDRLWAAKTDRDLGVPVDLVRLDRDGRVDGRPLRIPGRAGLRLATGAGSVWVLDGGNDLPPNPRRPPGVVRVDAERFAIVGAPGRVGADPKALAVGDGGVWVANAGSGSVSRIAL